MQESVNSGAYGFRLVPNDPEIVLPHLAAVDSDAPEVRLHWLHGTALGDARDVGPDRVRLAYRRGGSVTVRRDPPRAEFVLPHPTPVAAMVHPIGTMPLSVLAHWRGDATLHGGAFLHAGVAWGICGERSAGKSTTLALVAERGLTIMADDLLAIQGRDALAGPRCVDLRADAAARFDSAVSLGMVGERVRYRLPTGPAPARAPLRGIFLLDWSSDGRTEVTPLTLKQRLALLHAHQYSTLFTQPNGGSLMELLDLPMLLVRRPRDWTGSDAAVERMLAAASAH
jgi:hypothetical protein